MKCADCGREFSCEISEGKDRCWCFDYPAKMRVPSEGEDCFCPECLAERTGKKSSKSTEPGH